MSNLTSGALQTKVPARGSYRSDVSPQKLVMVMSPMVKFACNCTIVISNVQPRRFRDMAYRVFVTQGLVALAVALGYLDSVVVVVVVEAIIRHIPDVPKSTTAIE